MPTSPAEAADADFAEPTTDLSEPAESHDPDPGPDPEPQGPAGGGWGRVLRPLRAAALSPCTWLVTGAFFVYWAFAYNQYMQLQVGACDLGIFYQATEGWAFHLYPYVPIKGYAQIGDHFSPMFLVLAPLIWIFNSPLTLVFAQVALLCSSGIPVYLAIKRMWGRVLASILLVAYLFSIGMQGSIAFPVHEVMFGAPLVAWGIERALAGRWTTACVFIGLTVFVKEDMGALVAMFAVWLLMNRKWRQALILGVWGPVMMFLAVKVIIPHFNPNGFTYASDYAQTLHANSFGGEIKSILLHPHHAERLLFNNEAKRALWMHLLAPVAFMCLGSPIFLLAVPSLLSSLLSSRETQWSWGLYYQMPLMPIVFIGAVHAVHNIVGLVQRLIAKRAATPRRGWLLGRRPELALGLVLALFSAGVTWHYTVIEPIGRWAASDWFRSSPTWIEDVHEALAVVPSGVEVQATNNLLIPLAARDTATLVGSHVEKGDWAAIDTANPQCPITADAIPAILANLSAEGFVVMDQAGPIVIMHKI
jgi:uncharacterized membrane protein